MLMSAFSYHEGALYAESRAAAERYLEFFPADVDAPYAQFLIALSYYDQIVDIGRDQTDAFEALQEMRDIIERYPDSEYAKSAQMKFELALDHLAGKEMEMAATTSAAASIPPRSTASASWSRTTRPRPTPPRRCIGWSRPISRSASTTRRRPPPRSSATTSRALSGTRTATRCSTGRGLQPANVGDSWLNQTYRQVVQGQWR